MNITPTTEDRIWAVLSHLSALAFGMGIALPVIGWADQRRKSPYATFQCLQALGYQSLGFTVWVVSYLVVVIVAAIILLAAAEPGKAGTPRLGMLVIFIVVGFLILYLMLPIIAAIACVMGKDFRYPVLGKRLAHYLGYNPAHSAPLIEERELRWVAAMGHVSVLIWFWGMLAPLTAWLLYGRHSLFLKFQSAQTLIYQALATLLSLAGLFIYLFAFLLLLAGMGGMGNVNFSSPIAVVGMVTFAILALIAFALLMLVPFLHILGQWAGYRILQGDHYRYPVVGRLVDRWIHRNVL